MKTSKYIVTVDLDLPPLRSGLNPYFVFTQFPVSGNLIKKLIIALQRLYKILKWAQTGDVMVLDSTSGLLHPDLLACILIRFSNKKPIVIMTGDMWNKGNFLKYHLQKMMVQLADPAIQRYVVQSLGEQEVFPEIWDISQGKVRVCLYSVTFTPEEINAGEIFSNGYIFAGGNPNRDYDLLLEVARSLPHRQFIIATSRLDGSNDIPSNVKVVQVSHAEFIKLMRESDIVLTPIRAEVTRAAGQQTYLNAMLMGKVNIVSGKNIFGATDYIQNHVNGIITDGTSAHCKEAIEWTYNPVNLAAINKIKQLAQKSAVEFTYERHINMMASIIEEAIVEHSNQDTPMYQILEN